MDEKDRPTAESALEAQALDRKAIAERMSRIRYKILVMSGKGGVGKTTVAVNLATMLADQEKHVGLMDVDIHGPNIPKMIGIREFKISFDNEMIVPIAHGPNLKVMSIAFFLQKDSDAVIWRGPLKFSLIRQFLKDVDWGELDFLVIDAPPGTGDEPLSVCQLIGDLDGALVITTPQEISLLDVRKSITFLNRLNVPILGIIENMSGFICPHCGGKVDIFKSGGGERLAAEMRINFLGKIPIDGQIVDQSDQGSSEALKSPDSNVARSFQNIANNLMKVLSDRNR